MRSPPANGRLWESSFTISSQYFRSGWLLGLAGAALFTVLLIRQGVGQVLDAFATGEWAIMGIVVYHLIPILLDAIAWWVLFPTSDRLPLLQLFWMRWIGESVSALVT